MSASGKKKGKKKWTPVALDTVLPNAVVRPTTSWAEEVESELLSEYAIKKISSLTLPTAPRAACDLVIDESKISPNGPFVAYLSNLPYEITEDDIAQNFKELKITSIQLPKDDRQDRMKGFGYIEFKDKSNLIAALQEGELTLKGRNVRISLPADEEQKQERGSRSGGMSFGRNRDSDRDRSEKPLGEWRAGAPVPHDPEKSTASKHSGVGFTRQQNRDRDRDGGNGPFREFRSSGFQPAESGPSFSRAFRDRDDRDGGRSSDRGNNRPFKRFEPREERPQRTAFSKKFERDDRDREIKRESEREEPKQRPKLELLPRSIPEDTNRTPEALPMSIFGGAKPVDTTKREMEIEAKLHMANAAIRGSSPRLTPTSNLSRTSSVSSISSNRKREGDCLETANDSSKSSGQFQSDESKPNDGAGVTKTCENVWTQRSTAKTVSLVSTDIDAEDASSSVIGENSETGEDSSNIYIPPQQGSRAIHDSSASKDSDDRLTRYTSLRSENGSIDSGKWTTYNKDSFNTSSQQFTSGGRYGGGVSRYNDNKFSSNFNRDNRRERDRRDNHRDGDRRSDRYFQKRGSDDNYSGGGNRGGESNSFSSKWNHSNREGGSFRSRNNDFSGSRKNDRDNGGGGVGSYSNFRDKNENRSNRSFGSSRNNVRDHDIGEYRNSRIDDRRHYDGRLIDGEGNMRDSMAITDAQQKQPEAVDSRLKVSPEHDCRPLENGQENGIEREDGTRESSENLVNLIDSENENAFKTRKKHNKKKKNLEREDTINEKDLRSLNGDKKPRNQKEEKKNPDNNNLTIDKTPSKNNNKTKDNRTERNVKKSRESRDDISQMLKQKEEKTPNFQDTNRFQFLNPDD